MNSTLREAQGAVPSRGTGGKRLFFVDTTFRDGHTSLWASSMRTNVILPIAATVDRAGFQGEEIIDPTFLKKSVRDLGEDPWLRVRQVAERMPGTPLRAISGRHMTAFQVTPRVLTDLWLERIASNGVRQVRISDPSNTVRHWRQTVQVSHRAGLMTVINLIYSISPKHSDAYYVDRARKALALSPDRICLKDPGGLLTPERTKSLIPKLLEVAGERPLELHTHCNTGVGTLSALEAIRLGVRHINTAIPPLADASSNPSVYTVARNARVMGFDPQIDEELLRPATEHLRAVARRDGFRIGAPAAYDAYHYQHQVPGGMITNFESQLRKIGMAHRIDEILEETIRVRAELGHPIMVTPYSQFVGSQAAMNVLAGQRYKEVPDEVILYAMGFWGEEEEASVDPDIKDRILARPRARELAAQGDEPSLDEIRAKWGGPDVSDDELLLRYVTGEADVARMKAESARAAPLAAAATSAVSVIERLVGSDVQYASLQQDALSVTVRKSWPRL